MIAPAEILVKNASGNVLELVLSGQWNLGQNLPSTEEVLHRLESSVVEQIIFNSQDIAEWDSGLLTFVKRLRKQIEEKAIVLDISGLPPGVQQLLDNRLAFIGGIVDVTDYIDVYGLVNPRTDFNNYAFTTNPTIPAPDQGLGAAVRVMPTENIYIVAGIADANGDPTDPEDSINSFFSENEFFTHVEIGWANSWERRFSDNIHLTIWHADERKQAQMPNGWGAAFSFSRLFADKWEPFVRAGYAREGGALWEKSISVGLGYHTRKESDVLGIGINWSRPSSETLGPGLDDQYTAEIFYRFQLLKILTITPDVQVVFNPALNPDKNVIAVFGLRARISF
jgi:porin